MPLAVILSIGVFVCCHRLGAHGFWLDECYSAEISAGHGFGHADLPENQLIPSPPDLQSLAAADPWWCVLLRQGRDHSPPLYFLVLRAWRTAFGSTDVAMRALSVAFALAAAAMLYAAGVHLSGPACGFWAALLLVLANAPLELSRQVRPYAMLMALAIGALLVVLRIERHGWNRWRGAALLLAATGTLATHYLSLGWVLGLGAYVALAWEGARRRRGLVTIAAAVALFAMTVGPLEFYQARHVQPWWLQDHQPHHAARVLAALTHLPLQLFGRPYGPVTVAHAGWWLVFLLAPVLVVWRGRRDLLLPTVLLLATLAVPVGIDLARRTLASTQERYVILVVPAMCLLLARVLHPAATPGAARPGRAWVGHLVPAAVACFSATSLPSYYAEPINEDWRAITSLIARNARDGEPLILVALNRDDPEALPGTIYLCASRYVGGRHPVYLATRPLEPRDVCSLRSKVAWMVTGWATVTPVSLVPDAWVDEARMFFPAAYSCRLTLPSAVPCANE